jgi:hypothetical protein
MRRGRLSSPSTWIAGAAVACVAGAIGLAMNPAQAAGQSVTGTFGATGVTSSACNTEIGGNAVYVKPGEVFKANTSLVNFRVLGLSIPGTLQSVTGNLLVKHGTQTVFSRLIGASPATVAALPTGTYPYRFVAKYVTTKVNVPLVGAVLKKIPLGAGADFTWAGNVYSTAKKDPCGITISVPTTHVSVSAPGLPPVNVTLPGVTGPTLPNPLNSVSLPKLPNPGQSSHKGGHTGGHTGKTTPSTSVSYTPPAETVPQQVMPHANAVGGTGGFSAPEGGGYYNPPIVAPGQPANAAPAGGTSVPTPDASPAKKAVDLSSRSQLGGQQLPVLLAIAAILALVTVTSMYARLYLLRRPTK